MFMGSLCFIDRNYMTFNLAACAKVWYASFEMGNIHLAAHHISILSLPRASSSVYATIE